ncbi:MULTISPECIES: GNAT family N-acetyltransferase [Rhizobium/Agrobacterium group]|uniref:GNAT family N-acetyltransferase n=1 Tax=Neorhizobium petrolearium TaxID=515361 RepID=A0ABY8M7I2_9HYPH|nr:MULTISPECIES: GNAT family N-acetyltransferase [Rhizobium/Agrobacterium group]MCC2610349.1 GNAT family N-acetyltransferase [Neorhizobium petrolearium]WGI70501.1 GNAT family N-acetyltransferase [Neorhizobium petrolearium]
MKEPKIILETERLRLRSWLDSDRDLFREINADPKVMEFFPFRRSHEEADAFLTRLNDTITETGLGFYALELKETREPMGFCGLSLANMPEIFPAETVEIGWRLATRFWGHGYVTEAARALLDFAFDKKHLDAIVSFAVTDNHRSTAVMKRLGLHRVASLDFDHPRVPDTHPHLKPHVVYAVTRDEWLLQRQKAGQPR